MNGGETYGYGPEEVYKRFSADKDSLKLQEDASFIGRDLSYIYDAEDRDPYIGQELLTAVTFKYKSNGIEKNHTLKIDEVIDDIDRSGSFENNNYTIDIYDIRGVKIHSIYKNDLTVFSIKCHGKVLWILELMLIQTPIKLME